MKNFIPVVIAAFITGFITGFIVGFSLFTWALFTAKP